MKYILFKYNKHKTQKYRVSPIIHAAWWISHLKLTRYGMC